MNPFRTLIFLVCITAGSCANAQVHMLKNIFNVVSVDTSSYHYPHVDITEDFRNCGTGLKDKDGNWVVQPTYTRIEATSFYFLFRVMVGSKMGVIRSDGKILVQPAYDQVNLPEEDDAWNKTTGMPLYFNVKNYNWTHKPFNCYGITDSAGQVIIPAKNEDIIECHGQRFLVNTHDSRWEIWNMQGRTFVIPHRQSSQPDELADNRFSIGVPAFGMYVQYVGGGDWDFSHSGLFHRRIILKQRYVLVDDHGNRIINEKFSGMVHFNDSIIEVYRKKKNGFCSAQGKIIWPLIFDRYSVATYPTMQHPFAVAAVHGKYGVIDMKGDTLIPFHYDHIDYRSNAMDEPLLVVSNKNLSGIYSLSERWLLQPHYRWISRDFIRFRVQQDSSSLLVFIACDSSGKYGVISSAGQEILPFRFDAYEHVNPVSDDDAYIFSSRTDTVRMGIPLIIASSSFQNPGYLPAGIKSISRLSTVVPADKKFIVKKQDNGVTLFLGAPRTDSMLRSETEQLQWISHNTGADLVALQQTCILTSRVHAWKTFPDSSAIFHVASLTSFSDSVAAGSWYYCSKKLFELKKINTFYSDTSFWYFVFGSDDAGTIIRDDGKVIIPPGHAGQILCLKDKNGYNYFIKSYNNGWRDVKHPKDVSITDHNGNMRYLKGVNSTAKQAGNYLGVHLYGKALSRHSRKQDYSWNIYDLNSGTLLLPQGMESYFCPDITHNSCVITRNDGKGIFNIKQKKMTVPVGFSDFKYLGGDSNDYYAARTCHDHIGIVDGNGKWITDTTWTMYADAWMKNAWNVYYVFSNDNGHIIFNSRKGTIEQDDDLLPDLLNGAFNNMYFFSRADGYSNWMMHDVTAPSLMIDSLFQKNIRLLSWHKKVLFDSLFIPVRYFPDTSSYRKGVYICAYCQKTFPDHYSLFKWSKDYDRDGYLFMLQYVNDSCISFFRKRHSYTSFFGNPDLFSNVMLFPDGPHNLSLDSLFTGNDWKMFLINYQMNYLDTAKNISGECSNPTMIPRMLRDRFIITKNALEIFPPEYFRATPLSSSSVYTRSALMIAIPWEQLKPYLRKDIALKIGIR